MLALGDLLAGLIPLAGRAVRTARLGTGASHSGARVPRWLCQLQALDRLELRRGSLSDCLEVVVERSHSEQPPREPSQSAPAKSAGA